MSECTHSAAAESLMISVPSAECNGGGGKRAEPRCCCSADPYHRALSKASIICGCSCLGIVALVNSVKAETTRDLYEKRKYEQRAKRFARLSIAVFLGILVLIPLLMVFISYLITLRE